VVGAHDEQLMSAARQEQQMPFAAQTPDAHSPDEEHNVPGSDAHTTAPTPDEVPRGHASQGPMDGM